MSSLLRPLIRLRPGFCFTKNGKGAEVAPQIGFTAFKGYFTAIGFAAVGVVYAAAGINVFIFRVRYKIFQYNQILHRVTAEFRVRVFVVLLWLAGGFVNGAFQPNYFAVILTVYGAVY